MPLVFPSRVSWGQRFFHLLLSTLFFSLFLSAFFICLRLGFLGYTGIYKDALALHGHALSSLSSQIWQTLGNGMRYDNRMVAIFGLVFLLLALLSIKTKAQRKICNAYALLIIALCVFLQIANMTFYSIYGAVFDANLLEVFDESLSTLLSMAIRGEYFIGTKIFMWLICSALGFWVYLRVAQIAQIFYEVFKDFSLKVILGLTGACLAFFMLISINARFGLTAISLDLAIQPAENVFLRQITPGAFRNLYLVFKNHAKSQKITFANFSPKPLLQATQEYFNLPSDTPPPLDLGKLLEHQSTNPLKPSITHVFYIVSESLSSWHFDPKFDSIHLVSALKSLDDHQHGFIFPLFLENAKRTVKSLDVQITGLMGINDTNFVNMGVKIPSLPTAIGNQMKGLGFHNVFYYGGSGIWNRLDSFTKLQGFDDLIFNTYLLRFAKDKLANNPTIYPKPLESEWGVHDNILFDYILEKTPTNQPTFSMVMTLSNHTSRNVNLKAFGVPLKSIQAFVKATPKSQDLPDANFLGHIYWYDKILVDFIKKASAKFPNALFIITGDHFDRSFEYAKNNLYWKKSVPLILYAPSLKPQQIRCVGAHIDIAPTIMELIAPKGYTYASFGKPLFSNANTSNTCLEDPALGFEVIAAKGQEGIDFLYGEDEPNKLFYIQKGQLIPHKSNPQDLKLAKQLLERDNIANGLSWHYLFKGGLIK
ncbi:Phosphatidylglycerol-membrane-oligosaccharide glycerophosphotransferase MdoB [Helicobacter bizzozeronii]|uniref:LTA synthase family protein n=1 Tax=Helicobacter bizzozeronii TaxID=56877 RepID=UPI00244D890D|nr:LTA synthase family protein [Helicobacter bizzozeronii]GMB92461.1 Phosphatidylglycerol-membrane-oligosaccharide glycerophosphotransferase MdoB [Helicobacter bizzozeronii]